MLVFTMTGFAASAAPPASLGACCLVDECVAAPDEAACRALGGVFLPGEDCASDPCGVGACCAGEACVETDAFTCITGGRVFVGAGTRCEDDPCDIGSGACCIDGTCTLLDEIDCATAGGAWLGPGTLCANDPCSLGACCLPDECRDGARFECDALGGVFVDGLPCAEDACVDPKACPDGTLFGQPRDGPDDFLAGTSERGSGFSRFEDFAQVTGPIEAVRWWGLDLDRVGNTWVECEETDPTFEIAFHRDAGGAPGEEVCIFTVVATRTPLGVSYLGSELNEYHALLPEPCVLVNGWIKIVGEGDVECWFLWMSAGPGASYCSGCRPEEQDFDLSLCLMGEPGGVLGACCDEASGTCREDVDIADCAGEGQRFLPAGSCADFDPPCGVVVGACCFGDATCAILTEKECAAGGGAWLGSGTPCDRCPCLTPCPGDGIAEGEPRCGDGYVDEFDGGCTAQEPTFRPVALGDVICGESGVFDDGDGIDFDWYEVAVPRPMLLVWSVEAEFQPRIWIVDAGEGCPGTVLGTDAGAECARIELSAPVGPGTYWLVIAPSAFTDETVCGTRYTARVGPDPCPADLDGSGAVDFGDVLAVLAAWGPCPMGPACPADLDGSGVVDFADLLVVLAAWGPCPP